MAELLAFYENQDDIPEEHRDFYSESDSGFVLSVKESGGFTLENTEGLRTALKKERKNASDLKKKIEEYGEISPEDAKKALLKIQEWDENNIDREKEIEERLTDERKKLAEKFNKEKEEILSEKGTLEKEIESLIVDNEFTTALTTRDRKGDPELLLPHARKRVRVKRTDDGYVREILDKEGNPELDKNGNVVSDFGPLIESLESRFPGAFDAPDRSGGGEGSGGSGTGNGKSKTITLKEYNNMRGKDRAAFVKSGGKVES